MCGRFALRMPPKTVQQHFDLPETIDLPSRYNIAPSRAVAAIRQLPGKKSRQLDLLRWGLIPHWAKDMKIGYRMINARAETLAEKPAFRTAFRKRRCLIAADGFYEWRHEGKKKQPFFIHMKDETVFAFAGLWERWRSPDGETVESCTIITTSANKLISKIHDRMPVILNRDQYETWLTDSTPQDQLQQFLIPCAAAEMEAYRVGSTVNSPKNDTPECIQPV